MIVALLAAALMWLAGASYGLAADPAEPPLIVVAGPDTGPNAVITQEVRAGVDEAIADCRRHWTRCPTTAFVQHACSSSPEDLDSVAQAVTRIVAREPFLVVGHPCERAARTAAEAYAESGIPFVAVGVRDPAFREGFDKVPIGRIGANRAEEARALVGTAALPVAIVHDMTLRNSTRARLVRKVLENPGIGRGAATPPAVTVAIEASSVSYDEAVAKVVASKGHSVVLLTNATEAAIIIRQLRAAGFNGVISGPGEWVSEGLASTLSDRGQKPIGTVLALVPLHTPFAIDELPKLKGESRRPTREAVADLLRRLRLVPHGPEADAGEVTRKEFAKELVGFDPNACGYAVVQIGPGGVRLLPCAPLPPGQL